MKVPKPTALSAVIVGATGLADVNEPFTVSVSPSLPFAGFGCAPAPVLIAIVVQLPLRLLLTSHGLYVTLEETPEPEPLAMAPGPVELPHQLHVPLTGPFAGVVGSTKMPAADEPTSRLLRLMATVW